MLKLMLMEKSEFRVLPLNGKTPFKSMVFFVEEMIEKCFFVMYVL